MSSLSSSCKRDRRRSGGSSNPRRRLDCDGVADSDDDERTSTCDSTDPMRRYPAAFLTDLNNPSNRTCWISAPVMESSVDKDDAVDGVDGDDNDNDDEIGPAGASRRFTVSEADGQVSLTLNLGKKYEVTILK